jgi:hypothetical protein
VSVTRSLAAPPLLRGAIHSVLQYQSAVRVLVLYIHTAWSRGVEARPHQPLTTTTTITISPPSTPLQKKAILSISPSERDPICLSFSQVRLFLPLQSQVLRLLSSPFPPPRPQAGRSGPADLESHMGFLATASSLSWAFLSCGNPVTASETFPLSLSSSLPVAPTVLTAKLSRPGDR